MFKSYFLVAIRNLTRNKFFSAINIFGLAISMSVCMGLMMLVADQLNYDRYNSKRDRVFRVNTYAVDDKGNDRSSMETATSPMALRQEFLENYTGVEKVVRFRRGFGNLWLNVENQDVNIPVKGYYADPEVLDVFEYELAYGDPETALVEPFTVVLTHEAAKKLFDVENPIGQPLKVGDRGTFTVTGVLKETKNKSHIVFDGLASMATVKRLKDEGKFGEGELEGWGDFWNGWSYILIKEGKSAEDIMPHLEKMYQQHIATITNPDAYKAKFRLQSLMDITPGPLMNNAIGPSLPWLFVYFLGGLALVILLTSCFNFTNLSIARSLKRAKEIGVRKVTGAARWQIFTQFLSESIVISLCALILAFLFLLIVKPLILQLTFAKLFMWDLESNMMVMAVFVAFALIVGIFAGFFPAVVLSAFEPVKVLKNLSNLKLFSKMGLRKVLLVAQFTISLIFILSVIVMYNQLELFLNKDYGFNTKNNIVLKLNNTSAQNLKNELLKNANIKSVSGASHVPAAGTTWGDSFKKNPNDKEWTNLNYFAIDEDYLSNMEVELVAGKFFDAQSGESNKNFIVINELAVKELHYKNVSEALGQELLYQRDSTKKVIIGIVKDYNHVALMNKIEPLALLWQPAQIAVLQISYQGTHADAAKTIETSWAKVNPGLKSDFKEVEEEIKFFYNTVFGDVVNIVGVIAGLAIMISCLGLLGMATYTIETRMKEVSIRKVLGSSDGALIFLLSKGFLKLLLIAICLGVPAAWFINNLWLQFMAYHTSLDFGVALLGILVLLLFAGATIGSQTIRAAFTNPAENLKNE